MLTYVIAYREVGEYDRSVIVFRTKRRLTMEQERDMFRKLTGLDLYHDTCEFVIYGPDNVRVFNVTQEVTP